MIAIALVGLTLIGIPLYKVFKRKSDDAVCRKNFKGMADAISLYSESYDQRFPSVYEPGEGQPPTLAEKNRNLPVVWSSAIAPFMNDRLSFTCPAADESEAVRVNGTTTVSTMFNPKAKVINHVDLTYGMYVAMGTKPRSDFISPESTILLAETANHGAQGSFNPLPFFGEDGEIPYDGFLIAYNDSNSTFSAATSAVTRLAFYGVVDGDFTKATARHEKTINVLYIDGHIGAISPEESYVNNLGGSNLTGLWSDR